MADSTLIAAAVQNVWTVWNIRGFMIFSLCMQLILAIASPFRKKTSNGFIIFVVWSVYLLADWSAIFAFGLISNAGCRSLENINAARVPQDVMAFWAAFLLIHLGGPDTITAFSLEDNALWLRHLVGLLTQLSVFLYIFMKSFSINRLLLPTTLIFVAGVIKYGERTRALYLASLENLKKSIKKNTRNSLHDKSKGLIVDIAPDLREYEEEVHEFQREFSHKMAFIFISSELNLLYELFYTKIKAANSRCGIFARSIAYVSTLGAFILFCLADKHEFCGVDVAITYALFAGGFIVHVVDNMIFLTSEFRYEFTSFTGKDYILWIFGQGILPSFVAWILYMVTLILVQNSPVKGFINRVWSEKLGSFNLLSHCFRQCDPKKCQKPGFIWNKLAEMRHASREDYHPELWQFLFDDLKRRTECTFDKERMRKMYEARGDWAIEESGCCELKPYISKFQYEETLLIWHVATEICYNIEGDVGNAGQLKRFSKILSDYMMYLLVMQPKLMSAVAGIAHIRYEDTCVEAKLLGRKFGAPTMREFSALILEEHADITEPDVVENNHSHSILKDSCRLVQQIRGNDKRWEIILKVWVELLSYAAGHCRAESHARLLSEGGEFVTIVWILMTSWNVVPSSL